MKNGRLKVLWLFLAVALFYSAWMTGFKFSFPECDTLPNYNMLASAFVQRRMDIDPTRQTLDTIIKDGRQYLYSGPVPALLRVPAMVLFHTGLPTGFMIVLFCAGIVVLVARILDEVTPADRSGPLSAVKAIVVLTFIFNGYTLLMVTIPSFHHEAICAAMFFLLVALFFLFRSKKQGYRMTAKTSIAIGLALSLCIGSRFSYVFAVLAIGFILIYKMIAKSSLISKREAFIRLGTISAIGAVAMGLIFWYNDARFGGYLDFGVKSQVSLYTEYLIRQGYLRYDHFPYNFWSYFFRVPQFGSTFPYLLLPAYFLKVQSVGPMPYYLVNGNELVVSIFYLMPVLVIGIVPLISGRSQANFNRSGYIISAGVFAVQMVVISLSIATTARYVYDFLALLMIMSYLGAVRMQTAGKMSTGMFGMLAAVSVVISFALPLNAIRFYAQYIDFQSPLLKIFF